MRRTSSGNKLSAASLFDVAPTPYVYMAADNNHSSILSPQRKSFHGRCDGASVRPFLKPGSVDVPEFTAEIASGYLNATSDSGEQLLALPLNCINSARVLRKRQGLSAICSCCTAQAVSLALDMDAPSGWLHTKGMDVAGRVLLTLSVHECVRPQCSRPCQSMC